jgi:protein SCO1
MIRAGRWLAALGVAGTVLAGCSSGHHSDSPAKVSPTPTGTFRGQSFQTPRPRPSFTLTDTSNASYNFGTETRGHPTLLYFGYTNCPDICPTWMADFAVALQQVSPQLRKDTRVVFVTTDPTRDKPAVIRRWLDNFDKSFSPKFIGLTGTQAQIDAAQRLAGVPLASDHGQQHSAEVLLYGSDDVDRLFYTSGTSPSAISHDLPLVAAEKG